MTISRERAHVALEPYNPDFYAIVHAGHDDWLSLPPEKRLDKDVRCHRCWVWCEMVAEAKRRFDANPNVRIHEEPNTVYFVIDNELIVRFKKMDPDGRSQNIQTQLQLDLRDSQLSLPGIPGKLPTIEVGYVPDEIDLTLDEVVVAHPTSGGEVAWSYSIDDENGTISLRHEWEPVPGAGIAAVGAGEAELEGTLE